MKTSNKIAVAVAIIFMVLPAISYTINLVRIYNNDINWDEMAHYMAGRSIKVLELMDEHTAQIKDIYRTKHTYDFQKIHTNMHLGTVPEVFEMVGDTLKVKMPNNGFNADGPEIRNSFFNLNGLEYIIRNGKKYAINITGLDKHGTEIYTWEEVVE